MDLDPERQMVGELVGKLSLGQVREELTVVIGVEIKDAAVIGETACMTGVV